MRFEAFKEKTDDLKSVWEREKQELKNKFDDFHQTCHTWKREKEDLKGKIEDLAPKCSQWEQDNVRLYQKESECKLTHQFKDQRIEDFKEVLFSKWGHKGEHILYRNVVVY